MLVLDFLIEIPRALLLLLSFLFLSLARSSLLVLPLRRLWSVLGTSPARLRLVIAIPPTTRRCESRACVYEYTCICSILSGHCREIGIATLGGAIDRSFYAY